MFLLFPWFGAAISSQEYYLLRICSLCVCNLIRGEASAYSLGMLLLLPLSGESFLLGLCGQKQGHGRHPKCRCGYVGQPLHHDTDDTFES